jgi:hypothetical protein
VFGYLVDTEVAGMDDATAALIAGAAGFVGAVIGGVLSGVYQHARDWYTRPILKIDYAGKSGVNVVETEIVQGPTKISDVYIRARIRNTGRRPAQNCRVYMTALHEVKGNQLLETVFSDTKPIAWAGWDFEPRVVPNGVDFYVDVVRVNKDVAGWIFSVALFVSQETLKHYRGTYRFSLLATADGAAPTPFSVDVDYDNKDWHTLRAWHEPAS